MAKKSKEVKFHKDDLEKVQSLQQEYARITNLLGQMKITQLNIERQEQDLMEQLKNAQTNEAELLEEITAKYGPGQLDPATGTFVPIEQ
jgi:predicted FMN-binding regulatory protein PaiB